MSEALQYFKTLAQQVHDRLQQGIWTKEFNVLKAEENVAWLALTEGEKVEAWRHLENLYGVRDKPMTWGELKEILESEGVRDEDELKNYDIQFAHK